MSETPDTTPPATEPLESPAPQPAENGFFTSVRQLGMTRPADRWLGGVSGAIARRFGIDPLIVRAVFVASVFLVGLGLILYGVAWALLPEESDGRIHVQQAARGDADVALVGAGAMVVAGLVSGDGWWTPAGWWHAAGLGWVNVILWLAVVGVVVALVVSNQRTPGAPRPAPTAPPAGGAPAGTTAPDVPISPYRSESTMSTTAPLAPPPYTPAPAPSAQPKKPVAPGAGARYFAVCAGITLLTLAGILLAERAGAFSGPVVLTMLGVTAVVFGLGIIVAGLQGRTSGVLGFFAVLSIFLSFPAAVAADAGFGPWRSVERWNGVGSSTHTPTTVDELEGGFAVGLGDLVVDLTELEVPAGETVDLTVQAGTGAVEIILPPEDSARLALTVGMGKATWAVDGESGENGGLGVRHTVTNDTYDSAEDPTFDVTVNVGLGDITITQED